MKCWISIILLIGLMLIGNIHAFYNLPSKGFRRMLRTRMFMTIPEKMPKLILGSSSASRRKVLTENGFIFDIIRPDIDEKCIGDRMDASNAPQLVVEIAIAKAEAILQNLPDIHKDKILITTDQVLVCDNKILEKPLSREEAFSNYRLYSNNKLYVVGSLVLTNTTSGHQVHSVEVNAVTFNVIPSEVIDEILLDESILNCAGGLKIENPLIQPYINCTEGSIEGIQGLSLSLFHKLLGEVGINLR